MPGRYSHGLVLAQYSSQGIISLPNDDYMGSSARTRTDSAAKPRQRTISNATKSSGHQSSPAQSVRSSIPTSRTYNLAPSRSGTTQKRVVIVQSDSEGEHDFEESEEEWVRTQPTPSQRFTPPAHAKIPPAARIPKPSQPTLRSALRQSTAQAHEKPVQGKASSQRAQNDSNTPKKRSGGVRALIEARNKVEMEKASADGTSDQEQRESSLSLREFLRNTPKPNGPMEKSLTVQEFLQNMPAPDAERDGEEARTDRTDRAAKIDASPKIPPVAQSVPETKPATSDHPSAYRAQHRRKLETPEAASSAKSLPHETEPNFSDFTDAEEQSDFPFPGTSTPATIVTSSQKARHRFPKEKPVNVRPRTTPTSSANLTPPVNHAHQPAFRPRQGGSIVHETTLGESETRHVRSESSLSSLDSQDASIFGMSSTGGTTQATSGYSPTFRTLDKSAYQRGWNLPRVRHSENDDNFDDILTSMNMMTFNATSDEEVDDREHDLPASRLQRIPEKELSTGQWGTISARQSTSTRAREADELSEMSAVFPPDISRYNHETEVTSLLTMPLSGTSEDAKEPRRSSSAKSKVKKSANETGLLRKLKKKAAR